MSDSYDKRLIRFSIEALTAIEYIAQVTVKESFVEDVHQKWKQSEGIEENE